MNPDFDDPNNHVPPVSPDDHWEDLDEASEKSKMGLPPRKADRGLPPKKESRSPLVNHHKAKLKPDHEGSTNPAGQKWGRKKNDAGDTEPAEVLEVRLPPPAGKGPRRKSTRITKGSKGKKAAVSDQSSGDAGINAPDESGSLEPKDERVVLPPSTGTKRFRVKEIDPSSDTAERRISKLATRVAKPAEAAKSDDAPRVRRRFSRGESGSWGSKDGEGSLKWMLYSGIGILILVVIVVSLNSRPGEDSGRRETESFFSKLSPTEVPAPLDSSVLEELSTSQEEAKVLFAKFASAKSPDDFIGIISDSEKNAELIRERWKPMGVKAGWLPAEEAVWTVLERGDLHYGVLEGSLPDFTRFMAYFKKDDGELRMDWKASTGYGSADFSELQLGKGDGSEIRTWISKADFYTFSLPEGEFRSFRLMSPEGDSNLWAYSKVGTELDDKLIALFTPSQITGETQSEVQVCLKLEPGPEESLPNQWMIRDLLRLDWMDN